MIMCKMHIIQIAYYQIIQHIGFEVLLTTLYSCRYIGMAKTLNRLYSRKTASATLPTLTQLLCTVALSNYYVSTITLPLITSLQG